MIDETTVSETTTAPDPADELIKRIHSALVSLFVSLGNAQHTVASLRRSQSVNF